jgi:hypothetical protein
MENQDKEIARLRSQFRECALAGESTSSRMKEILCAARDLLCAYKDWSPDHSSAKDTIEIFAPALLRTKKEHFYDAEPDSSSAFLSRDLETKILNMCLYVDCLWIPDPLEILASKFIHQIERYDYEHFEEYSFLAELGVHDDLLHPNSVNDWRLDKITRSFRPLIEAGIIRLYPALTTYHKHVSNALFGIDRSFTAEEMKNAWPDLYVAEGLLYAKAFDASYTALRLQEFGALERASKELLRSIGTFDHRVLAALPCMTLPFLEKVDAETITSVRSNDESFADFRKLLRELSRDLVAGVEDPAFELEVQRLEQDKVTPGLRKLYEDVNGTTSLRARLTDFGTDFTAGALGTLVLKSDVKEALLGGTATALAKALARLLMQRTKGRPAASAVYEFHTGKKPRAILP